MALVVRISNGAEDFFSRYPGCTQCAWPVPDGDRMERCPQCQAEIGSSRYYYSHEVIEEGDGSLTVLMHGTQVGRYLQGAWLNFRHAT